jgi:hypothetical protein
VTIRNLFVFLVKSKSCHQSIDPSVFVFVFSGSLNYRARHRRQQSAMGTCWSLISSKGATWPFATTRVSLIPIAFSTFKGNRRGPQLE